MDASALTYQKSTDVNFTIQPSVSISLDSSTLKINDLSPGQSADSNTIRLTVESNNSAGYVINSTVGNSTDYTNTNLKHATDTSATADNFTSLATTDSIATLADITAGKWGYSFSTDSGAWSDYSGLPLYTTDTPTKLVEKSSAASSTIDFKIAAKGKDTQAAGEYNNIINFIAVVTPAPSALYMQDVSTWASTIPNTGDSVQAVDNRDGKSYWVTREADGNIWMTQNLDLEIGGEGVADLTSENTNLTTSGSGAYSTDYTISDGIITWKPTLANTNATVTGTPATITNYTSGSPGYSVSGWSNNNNKPYVAEGGNHYIYTSGTTDAYTLDVIYNSINECTDAGHSAEGCAHYHVGNYYNWTAAIASSASDDISAQYTNATNSICPAGWRLPVGTTSSGALTAREFEWLWRVAGVTYGNTTYAKDGFLNIRQSPLFFVRGGHVNYYTFNEGTNMGSWWSSTVNSSTSAYYAFFSGTGFSNNNNTGRFNGFSVRCLFAD